MKTHECRHCGSEHPMNYLIEFNRINLENNSLEVFDEKKNAHIQK
jgi:hypothetical protein